MDPSRNASIRFNQEPRLPSSDEGIIKILGLENNDAVSLDDVVKILNLDSYTQVHSGEPDVAIGIGRVEGELIGNCHVADRPTETFSYVDLTPVSPYLVSGGSVFIDNSSLSLSSPQEVNSFAPTTPVENQGHLQLVNNSQGAIHSTETISYADRNSSYHACGGSLVFNEDDSPPGSPIEVSSLVSTTPVEYQDAQKPACGKTQRRKRDLKPKLYQREEPMSDPEEEKKRLNAINAKRNRDKKKNRMQELEDLVKSLIAERDALQSSNTKLKNKCQSFERQLRAVCEQFNVPVIILPED